MRTKNATPITRTGFKRPVLERKPPVYRVLARAPTGAKIVSVPVVRAKENVIRSESYRRLVAVMPCKACGIGGYSQAAHVPPDGKGIKQDDRLTFPLCCARLGVRGCHADFDQYYLLPSTKTREMGRKWAAETRATIINDGNWPEGLPMWPQDQLA